MIPRYQTVLFIILFVASAVMGTILWQLRKHAHERLVQGEVTTPTKAPQVAPAVQATLYVANDADGSLTPEVLSLPLPSNPNERARAVLSKLLDIYATPGAAHSVPGGASSVTQVFLLPASSLAAGNPPPAPAPVAPADETQSGPELAVVNLTSAFANNHPSGLETETLTVLSICDTLHANLPRITEVRFLVDGQPRPTLAGHANLMHTYLATGDSAAPPIAVGASQ